MYIHVYINIYTYVYTVYIYIYIVPMAKTRKTRIDVARTSTRSVPPFPTSRE